MIMDEAAQLEIDDASMELCSDGKYIREWLVLGPFFPDDLDRDFLADAGGEANIQPRARYLPL